MSAPRDQAALHAFTGAVAHDLRTPLAAVTGEIELALRRDRPAAAYRDALSRVAEQIEEIVQLTGDLAFAGEVRDLSSASAPLVSVLRPLAALAARDALVLPEEVPECRLAGEERWLARAVALIVQHGIKHRAEGGAVYIRIGPPTSAGIVDLLIEARPSFRAGAWRYFERIDAGLDPDTPGLFRLTTASRILRACGGRAEMSAIGQGDAVQIRCVRT